MNRNNVYFVYAESTLDGIFNGHKAVKTIHLKVYSRVKYLDTILHMKQ